MVEYQLTMTGQSMTEGKNMLKRRIVKAKRMTKAVGNVIVSTIEAGDSTICNGCIHRARIQKRVRFVAIQKRKRSDDDDDDVNDGSCSFVSSARKRVKLNNSPSSHDAMARAETNSIEKKSTFKPQYDVIISWL
jgi:hypothetical protein